MWDEQDMPDTDTIIFCQPIFYSFLIICKLVFVLMLKYKRPNNNGIV